MKPSTRSSSLSKGKLKTVDPVSEDASTQKAKTSGQQSAYYPLFYKKSNQGQSEGSNNDKESASSQPTAWKEDAEDIDDLEDESKETTEGDINVEGTSGPNGSAIPNETSGTPLAPPKGSQDTVQRNLISVWDLPVPIIPQPSRKRPSSSTKRKPGAVVGIGRGKARSKLSAKVTAKVHQNVQQKDAEEYRPVRNAEAEQSGGKKQKGTGAGKEKRGVKRPAVIRAVEKPSKKKRKKNRNGYGDDDWIVSDDEDQEVRDDDGGTDWQSGYERSSPGFDESSGALYSEMASGRATSPFKPSSITSGIVEAASAEPLGATYYTFHTLTNCLLLTGPSGTGKTATVYACAEEMGWDVCELYPGIGKRTGAVMVSVGEGIGSNHVIGLGGSAATASTRAKVDAKAKKPEVPGGLKGFFKVKDGSDPLPTGTGTKDEPLLLEAPASTIENSEEKTTDIRQSIILIEEVDVLFAEDKNFWQGVVSLIGESRRPVILTCNDPNIVPIQDLPLQGTLTFEAPPGPLLASYLRILGLINNKVVAPDAAQELLSRSIYRPIGADLPDAPRHPLPYQEEPVVDMRKAINQLQFRCVHIDKEQEVDLQRLRTMYLGEGEEMQETLAEWSEVPGSSEARRTIDGHEDGKEAIEGLWKFMEVVSLMDSHLNRRSESSLEALSVDRYAESADDEIGYHHLPKMEYIGSGIAFYNREEEIGLESVILGRERLASSGTRVGVNGSTSGVRFDSGRLYASRGVHQLKLASYLDEIVDGRHVPLLPRGVMIMEYVGHIERMVKIEDERERLGGSERRGKRYVRQVGLSLGGLHVARDAMFPSW
ncbi:hypothetical protein FRC03_012512 [Tulasnella sp. 419]|nr:hypothetical protein FRC03_012512 [Tulasnella sp. 419]